MAKLNKKLYELGTENTFSNIIKKTNEYKKLNPDRKVISLGVGDVTRPIFKPILDAMHKALDELSSMDTFKGYGPSSGYSFLKQKILENDYKDMGLTEDNIYISCGTKTDSTSILELFDINSKIYVTDPMYPIYRDGAICLNRKTKSIKINEKTDFIPDIPKKKYDLIYICSPGNPIGIAYNYNQLSKWVDYALENDSVILYDNVYNTFITSKDVPKSIYEIPNAKKVAIEFRSFSKSIGFTGVRCSYFVIPGEINKDINRLWKERTINRFNGTDYIAQRGAEASYTEETQKLIKEDIKYYLENADYLIKSFEKLDFKLWGGKDSPFIWVKIKDNMTSLEYYEFILKELNLVIVPGIIFGEEGDRYFRISALGKREDILKAIERLEKYYEK